MYFLKYIYVFPDLNMYLLITVEIKLSNFISKKQTNKKKKAKTWTFYLHLQHYSNPLLQCFFLHRKQDVM